MPMYPHRSKMIRLVDRSWPRSLCAWMAWERTGMKWRRGCSNGGAGNAAADARACVAGPDLSGPHEPHCFTRQCWQWQRKKAGSRKCCWRETYVKQGSCFCLLSWFATKRGALCPPASVPYVCSVAQPGAGARALRERQFRHPATPLLTLLTFSGCVETQQTRSHALCLVILATRPSGGSPRQ